MKVVVGSWRLVFVGEDMLLYLHLLVAEDAVAQQTALHCALVLLLH